MEPGHNGCSRHFLPGLHQVSGTGELGRDRMYQASGSSPAATRMQASVVPIRTAAPHMSGT